MVPSVRTDTFLANAGPVFHLGSMSGTDRRTLKSAYEAGLLIRVLPGTYVPVQLKHDFAARCAAVSWWSPDAVIVGAAAAKLTFWPELTVRQIDVARLGRVPTGPGYGFQRRRIDPDFILERHRVRVTRPALTAIDLVTELGGDAIDTCLRSRTARLEDLWAAFAANRGRPGNAAREWMLLDSRDKPWSAAERLAHRLLRAAGVTGWKANLEVTVDEAGYFIDIAFRAARLAVEIDGHIHEDAADMFQSDRYRQNALVRTGWRVLRFTYEMLVNRPQYVLDMILAALARS